MVRWWKEPAAPEWISEWRRASHPTESRRAEELFAFRERLTAALRAGHGLGAAFGLRIDSGPNPELALGCSDPASARWVGRLLVPVYGRSSWSRGAPRTGEPVRERLWGRRVHSWPEALREPSDGFSAMDSLSLALSGAPSGASVCWRFLPCPASWGRSTEGFEGGRPRFPNEGTEPADRGSRGRRWDGAVLARLARSYPLFWKGAVSLALSAGGTDAPERVRAAVEVALRSGRANGIRFSRSHLPVPWGPPWFLLSEDELALFLPGLEGEAGSVEREGDQGPPVLPLGRSTRGRVIGPSIELDQGRHLAVLGETGMGKSSTLVAVARKASAFGGVVLFDPLGETAHSFLTGLADRDRSRLLVISPRHHSSGINALEGIGGEEVDPVLADRRLNDLVHALRRVRSGRYLDSSYWGPRLEEMLTRALRAAAAFPSGTLEDAHALLAAAGRSHPVAPPEAQEAVRALADRVRERPDDAEGARRLLYEVVRSPVLHAMLCERNPVLHPREVVEAGRIAVVSGEAATVGESVARYLLAVHLALVWSELLARPSRSKTFVVLDETQWFSHESLAEMLRVARRRNVHIVLATQTIGSLPEPVAESVWTNVSDFVAFRGSPEEAREFARITRGVSVEELLALPRGHAAVLLGKGNSVEWVRAVGRPPGPEAPPQEAATPPAGVPTEGGTLRQPREREAATVERALGWILERARSLAPGESLRVELSELKSSLDPEGRVVREVGSRLGRAGAILSRTQSASGPVWVLDPARIPAGTGEALSSTSSGAS